MQRILIIGSGGAGKSTFARQLHEILKIELIHLDALYWQPGWIEPPKDEWHKTIAELLKRETWIIDGNYGGTLEMRLAACDTVIFLDVPRLVCLWRILKRFIRYRHRRRPDMAADCPERIDWEFIEYIWNYPKITKPRIEAKIKRHCRNKTVVYLTRQKEITAFLNKQRHRA